MDFDKAPTPGAITTSKIGPAACMSALSNPSNPKSLNALWTALPIPKLRFPKSCFALLASMCAINPPERKAATSGGRSNVFTSTVEITSCTAWFACLVTQLPVDIPPNNTACA